jgi:hypothetical protein
MLQFSLITLSKETKWCLDYGGKYKKQKLHRGVEVARDACNALVAISLLLHGFLSESLSTLHIHL